MRGNYLMYWDENQVNIAMSKDLINWEPLPGKNGDLKAAMHPRKGCFDSALTECGPPALLTDRGILLLYNGKNSKGQDRDFRCKDKLFLTKIIHWNLLQDWICLFSSQVPISKKAVNTLMTRFL